MTLTDLPIDIVRCICDFVQSDRDLAHFNQTCRVLWQYTKEALRHRTWVLSFKTLGVVEGLHDNRPFNVLQHLDSYPAGYIQAILDHPRITIYVRSIKLAKSVITLNELDTSVVDANGTPILSHNRLPPQVGQAVDDVLARCWFLSEETKTLWHNEAASGMPGPLTLVLLCLCPGLKTLDMTESMHMIQYLRPILYCFAAEWRHLRHDTIQTLSVYPFSRIVNLNLNMVTVNEVIMFFQLPSLRKVHAMRVRSEDQGATPDHWYLPDHGGVSRVEELVLLESDLRAADIAFIIQRLPTLRFFILMPPWEVWPVNEQQVASYRTGHGRVKAHLMTEQNLYHWVLRARLDEPLRERGLDSDVRLNMYKGRLRWRLWIDGWRTLF